MQGDDPRQARYATDKRRQVVIGTYYFDLYRQFDIELLDNFRLQLDFLELQPTAQAGTGDVLEQARHFGIAWQLTKQGTERGLHLDHLFLVGLQVRRLKRLGGKLLLERLFLRFLLLQVGLHIAEIEVITFSQHESHQQNTRNDLDCRRPGAEVVHVQFGQVNATQTFQGACQTHGLPPSASTAGCVCWNVSWKTISLSTAPAVTAFTSFRFGASSQSEPSRLRIRLETLLLDSAAPTMAMFLPVIFKSVKYTPSGKVLTSWSNTRPMMGRLPCRS